MFIPGIVHYVVYGNVYEVVVEAVKDLALQNQVRALVVVLSLRVYLLNQLSVSNGGIDWHTPH